MLAGCVLPRRLTATKPFLHPPLYLNLPPAFFRVCTPENSLKFSAPSQAITMEFERIMPSLGNHFSFTGPGTPPTWKIPTVGIPSSKPKGDFLESPQRLSARLPVCLSPPSLCLSGNSTVTSATPTLVAEMMTELIRFEPPESVSVIVINWKSRENL